MLKTLTLTQALESGDVAQHLATWDSSEQGWWHRGRYADGKGFSVFSVSINPPLMSKWDTPECIWECGRSARPGEDDCTHCAQLAEGMEK